VRLSLTGMTSFLLLTPAASRQLTAIRVPAAGDLQAAIDAARPGDVLLLEPRARFVGNFVLPKHSDGSSFVTIRTAGGNLPPEGVRTGPEYADRLAVLQSPNGTSALRTARGAHHWRIENLEFRANADGYGNMIDLGDATDAQRRVEDVPHSLILDRLYIHGDPAVGQKRGIALNSAETQIRNCYISDIKGVGVDTQAIGSWNGPGPFTIDNNYIEAAAENVLFGGGDPRILNLVPHDIRFTRNHVAKPVSWRNPIVARPEAVRASASVSNGDLRGGIYTYRVIAERPAGRGTMALSEPSAPVDVRIESTSSGSVALEWKPVAGATAYRIYRSSAGGASQFWRATAATFTDTGTAGSAQAPPDKPSRWLVKNLFELKSARHVLIEGNVFEYNWLHGQVGYAILFTPRNQDGGAPWTVVEDVTFTNNIVRHVGAAVNILGTDDQHESGRARRITILNNLLVDVDGGKWGGPGDFIQVGDAPTEITVDHNTVLQTGRIITAYIGRRGGREIHGFVFRNNLVRHNEYGVKGEATATGMRTLAAFFPGVIFEANVLAGADKSRYPPRNQFPAVDQLEANFANARTGDFRLRADSPLRGAGTDRRDIGADVDAIEVAMGNKVVTNESVHVRSFR
jgi:hypothetical protein